MPTSRRSIAPRLRTLALGLVALSAASYGEDHVWNPNKTSGWFYDPANYQISGSGVPLFYFGGRGAKIDLSGGPTVTEDVSHFYVYQDTVGAGASWTFTFGGSNTRFASGYQEVKSDYIQGARDQGLSTTWTNAHFAVAGTATLTGSVGSGINTLYVEGGTGDLANPSWKADRFIAASPQSFLKVVSGASFVTDSISRQFGSNVEFNINVANGGLLSTRSLSGFSLAVLDSGAQVTVSEGVYADAKTNGIVMNGTGTTLTTPVLQIERSYLDVEGGAVLTTRGVEAAGTSVTVNGAGASLQGDLFLTDQTDAAGTRGDLTVSNGGAIVGDVGLLAFDTNVDAVVDGGSIKGAMVLYGSGGGASSLTLRNGSTVNFLRVDPFTGYDSRISGSGTLSVESGSAVNVPITLKDSSISVSGGSSLNDYVEFLETAGGKSPLLVDASTVNGGVILDAQAVGSSIDALLDHGSVARGVIGLYQNPGATTQLTVQGGSSLEGDNGQAIFGNGTLVVRDGGSASMRLALDGGRVEIGDGGTVTQSGSAMGRTSIDVAGGGRLDGTNFFADGSSLVAHDGATLRGRLMATGFDLTTPASLELRGASSDYQLAALSVGGIRFTPDFGSLGAAGSRATVRDGAIVRVDGAESSDPFDVVDVFEGSVLAVSADSRVGIGPASADPVAQSGLEANTVTVFQDGHLYGEGTIQGVEENGTTNLVTVVNAGGNVDPGNSPGALHILGDYFQKGGTLNLEIGGLTPDLEYDQLDVSGDITFTGGTIHILPYAGYVLPNDAEFQFFTGFAHLTIDPSVTFVLDGGLTLKGFDSRTGIFSIKAPAAVPEPATLAAMVLGLACLARRRRQG